ncbi:BRO family protein [Zooshikella ganghwensis]|uniref:Phage repressor protein/antirepressor Ant n=1 Tax=Zooshikella ganghwensis TaxID=202772 RepID=A0A4P9VHF5_9GAMM|nr:BRO family protein [Zooshikella ganghwensis]RDH41530.1 phage repressor protein/antirepressor Ant [Zooshikella ganghwensis]RDH41557.1 phage repressor protein/antirepressor Ant [Zooshikella ganghwensis]
MNIIPFQFNSSSIRVINKEGEPWFVATDIAKTLGYREAYDMTRFLDDDEKGPHILRTPGGSQELQAINESGLYSAILKSRRPEAKQFKRWVTHEVLPSIRKNGGYIAGQENDSPELIMAKALKMANTIIENKTKQLEIANEEIREAQPKIEFYDDVTNAEDAITVAEAAKVLDTGRNRLMSYLRAIEWVNPNNEPYQATINSGIMDVKLSEYCHPVKGLKECVTPMITGKGLTKLKRMRSMH